MMKIPRIVPLVGIALGFIGATVALSAPRAHAQDGSIFGGQQQGDTETSPDKKKPPLTITGEWTGSIDDNLAGDGTLDVDFTETPNGTLSGEWSFAFEAGTDYGTIKGKASSDKVKITFVFVKKKPYTHCRFSIDTSNVTDAGMSNIPYKFAACGPHTKDEHGTLSLAPE